MNNSQAIKKLIETQKRIIEEMQKKELDDIDKADQQIIMEKLTEIEKLLPKTKEKKFPQSIQFDGENFSLIQSTNGGKYILWSSHPDPDSIQCGTGFTIETQKTNKDYIDIDLFLAETTMNDLAVVMNREPDNKNIACYIYDDPSTEDYTYSNEIEYKKILESLEVSEDDTTDDTTREM